MDYIVSLLHSLSKYGSITRSLVKKALHSITGQCELERLCQSNCHDFHQCQEIEFSLYHSHSEDVRRILVADKMKVKDAMQTILRVKRIVPDKDLVFLSAMPKYLRKIISYNALLTEVDKLKNIKYNEENDEHEKLLYKLWSLMMPNDTLAERHTDRWTEIGFQGKNPATDFRGMGMLSLKNLVYMFENCPDRARKIFGQSKHPKYGFSFAIMGINFTGTTFELLRNAKLKGYVYNLIDNEYTLEHYQQYFVEIFGDFADFWIKKQPPNIMFFNEVKEEFMKDVFKRLEAGSWK